MDQRIFLRRREQDIVKNRVRVTVSSISLKVSEDLSSRVERRSLNEISVIATVTLYPSPHPFVINTLIFTKSDSYCLPHQKPFHRLPCVRSLPLSPKERQEQPPCFINNRPRHSWILQCYTVLYCTSPEDLSLAVLLSQRISLLLHCYHSILTTDSARGSCNFQS